MSFSPINLTFRRPLVSSESVSAILDRTAEEVVHLAESGDLLAFNVSVKPDARRCLRISTDSLDAYIKGTHRRSAETPGQVRQQIAEMFPLASGSVRTATLARVLNICPRQARNLIKSDLLEVIHLSTGGQGNSSIVTRASCINFILSRRIQ